MFKYFLESLPKERYRQVKYISVIYWLTICFSSYFHLQYFFEYKYYDLNWILWPLFTLTLLLPVLGRLIKNYVVVAILLQLLATSQAGILIYAAGGMLAPGIFWLAIFPVSGGILLGRRGAIFGTVLMLLYALFYTIAQYNWEVPNVVALHDNYDKQRIVNFVGFSIFSIWMIFYFLSHEADAQEEIKKHKSEIESLLHILIHDVASPLAVMEMDIKKLLRNTVEPELNKSVVRIDRNLKNVISLLRHIRQMKSVRDGKATFEKKPVEFVKVLNSTLENIKIKTHEKQIQIVNECKLDNSYILGDDDLLQNIVLNNLLANAVKFTPMGEKIVLKGRSDDKYIYFEIQDYGVGMPESILKNIFSLTYRTSRPGTGGEKGTGYGMLLVKEYVEKMDGRIKITSVEVGSGTGPSGTLITLVFSKFDNTAVLNTIDKNAAN